MSTAMWRLRPTILLPAIVSPCFSFWSFDRLAVDDASGWARFASHALSVEHQRDVVDRLKQEPTDKSAKPPIDRLPRREIIRQHPPSPARTGHVADCVQHLPQIDLDRSPSRRCAGKKGLNPRPFLVGQVARIPFGLLLDLGHSAARCWGPHPKLEITAANRIQRLFKRTLYTSLIEPMRPPHAPMNYCPVIAMRVRHCSQSACKLSRAYGAANSKLQLKRNSSRQATERMMIVVESQAGLMTESRGEIA